MRPSRLELFLCLGIILAALWIGCVLQAGSPQDTSSPVLNTGQVGGEQPIRIRYRDLQNISRHFDCTIDRQFTLREEQSFGYPLDHEVLYDALDRRLKSHLDQTYGPFYTFTVTHEPPSQGDLRWHAKPRFRRVTPAPGKPDPALLTRTEMDVLSRKIFAEYLGERGFELTPDNEIGIAYKKMSDLARPMLADCYDKLVRQTGAAGQNEILRLLLAVFQDMPYDLPPASLGEVAKGDFRVPTQVLQLGKGDCDSKSAALCALWQSPSPQILLVLTDVPEDVKRRMKQPVDRHALLGVEAYPSFDQAFLTVGLRNYVLCEVVMPDDRQGPNLEPGERLFVGRPGLTYCMTSDCG